MFSSESSESCEEPSTASAEWMGSDNLRKYVTWDDYFMIKHTCSYGQRRGADKGAMGE